MVFDRLSNKEDISDTGYDLINLQKKVANSESLKDRLGEDEVCKELEKNDEILWNERFSEPFPDDLLGSPPSSSGGSKSAIFELTSLTKSEGSVFAYVTIGYQELPDGSIYFTRKVSFRTDDSFSLSQYTPENKIHRRLLRTLERHASEFLPKKSDEINEHTGKSLGTIHYLPNSK